jgi:hypothetical protein
MTANSRHLSIRNVPPAVARALEQERRRRGTSLNKTVIELLAAAVGVAPEAGRRRNGLERMAGTWTAEEAAEFEAALADFEQVDEELWR